MQYSDQDMPEQHLPYIVPYCRTEASRLFDFLRHRYTRLFSPSGGVVVVYMAYAQSLNQRISSL